MNMSYRTINIGASYYVLFSLGMWKYCDVYKYLLIINKIHTGVGRSVNYNGNNGFCKFVILFLWDLVWFIIDFCRIPVTQMNYNIVVQKCMIYFGCLISWYCWHRMLPVVPVWIGYVFICIIVSIKHNAFGCFSFVVNFTKW